MAVTCDFKKKTAALKLSEPALWKGQKQRLVNNYEGGNCLCVMCLMFKKTSFLQLFISDIQHYKNMMKSGNLVRIFKEQFTCLEIYKLTKGTRLLANVAIEAGLNIVFKLKG